MTMFPNYTNAREILALNRPMMADLERRYVSGEVSWNEMREAMFAIRGDLRFAYIWQRDPHMSESEQVRIRAQQRQLVRDRDWNTIPQEYVR